MRFIIKREKIVETNQSTEELIDNIKSYLEKGDIKFLRQSINELVFINYSINFAGTLAWARKGEFKIYKIGNNILQIQMKIDSTSFIIMNFFLFLSFFIIFSFMPVWHLFGFIFPLFLLLIKIYDTFYRLPNLFFKKILHKD